LLLGGFVFATLHLWLTALTQTVQGLQWLALAFKSFIQPSLGEPEAEVSDSVITAWPSARAMQAWAASWMASRSVAVASVWCMPRVDGDPITQVTDTRK
jgi:hypothetical protein